MFDNKLKGKSKTRIKSIIITAVFLLITISSFTNFNNNHISAHSTTAAPKEIFSLWNGSININLDGQIEFTPSDLTGEWSSAAVYNMFDVSNSPTSKLLLLNDNSNLYVALDMLEYQVESPVTTWGCAIYFDRDHNGILSSNDRAVYLNVTASSDVYVSWREWNVGTNSWEEIESGLQGTTLPISSIIGRTDFGTSYFSSNSHRQYELKIPLSNLQVELGNVTGAVFEAFDDYSSTTSTITWPYSTSNPSVIRTDARYWGDLNIGFDDSNNAFFAQYVEEANKNVKSSAVGLNNGTFIGTADIDGNGDLELIASSNRTVSGDTNLVSIFDYVSGELTQIWASWNSGYESSMFLVKGIASFDFDENSEDEIYLVGETTKILRLFDWNGTNFDSFEECYTHTYNLNGFIDIGDIDSDSNAEIIFSYYDGSEGKVQGLEYNDISDSFSASGTLDISLPSTPENVYAIRIGTIDDDAENELYTMSTIDEASGYSVLEITYDTGFGYFSDSGDGLNDTTRSVTYDYYSHTILIEDVDNDNKNEVLLAGRDYIKVFNNDSFNVANAPLELIINDNSTLPYMGGGAAIGDVDGDANNELIIGCNNGTIIIMEVTENTVTDFDYSIEWFSDFGSSIGKRNSMFVEDLDSDSENELFFGDNFGQIISLGKSDAPVITLIDPSFGHFQTQESSLINWSVVEDFTMHHYEVYVNSTLDTRVGGAQTSALITLQDGINNIDLIGYDITGKSDSFSTQVIVSLDTPEVTITSPESFSYSSTSPTSVSFTITDRNSDLDRYEIYRNGSLVSSITVNPADTSFTGSVPFFSDGLWNVTVVGIDDQGHHGRDSIYIIYDATFPLLTITAPSDNVAVKTASILLQWTASDSTSGLDYFEIYKDSILNYTSSGPIFSYIVYLEDDQEYQFQVRAYDKAGNFGIDTVTITRDTIAPIVNITSPTTDYFTTQDNLDIQWTNADNILGSGIDYTEVLINGVVNYTGSANSANIYLGSEGRKDILVKSYDRAGNFAIDYILVYVDNSAPSLTITSPIDNYNTSLGYVIVDWECSDAGSGISQYEVLRDTTVVEVITNPHIKSAKILLPQNISYTITIRATDNNGRQTEKSITVNQNETKKDFGILDPILTITYTNTNNIYFEWSTSNLVNLDRFVIYLNDTVNYTISNIATLNYTINLGTIAIDEFPIFNITIIAVTITPDVNYSDMRWVKVDQAKPTINIISPTNNSIVHTQNIEITWESTEEGTEIDKYLLKIDDIENQQWFTERNYTYIILDEFDGAIEINIEITDLAGNSANSTISLQIFLLLPVFEIDIESPYYIPDANFNFNLTVTDAKSGIKNIAVLVDAEEIKTYNYDNRTDSFTERIDIFEDDYSDIQGSHDLTIAVYDSFKREVYHLHEFILDTTNPGIVSSLTINNTALDAASTEPLEIDLENSNGEELTFSITISDNIGIMSVSLQIFGEEFDNTYAMSPQSGATPTLGRYSITLNTSIFELGDYTLTVIITDFAGNSISESYQISFVRPTVIPWILQGNNLLYVSIGGGTGLILIIAFSITTRKLTKNLGWKGEIVTISYILNGLPCVYMVNRPELIKDEMLFGGAMTGIRGVLEEITGEKSKMQIQSVEMGKRKVMICPGNFGDAVLMVNKIKPIHKSKLIEFTESFETYYGDLLKNDPLITPDTFRGASILVESHFGISEQMVLMDECHDYEDVTLSEEPSPSAYEQVEPTTPQTTYQESYQQPQTFTPQQTPPPSDPLVDSVKEIVISDEPKTVTPTIGSIEEIVSQMSEINQTLFIEIIQLTQNAITSLMEQNLDSANESNVEILARLEILLKSQTLPVEATPIMRTLLNITQDLYAAIEMGQKGNMTAFTNQVEKISKLWLQEIGEKW